MRCARCLFSGQGKENSSKKKEETTVHCLLMEMLRKHIIIQMINIKSGRQPLQMSFLCNLATALAAWLASQNMSVHGSSRTGDKVTL